MLTVPEAARRVRRNPETIRRRIRAGRLRSQRIGSQHLIEEADLQPFLDEPDALAAPGGWGVTPSGAPMPDGVRLIRKVRESR